MFLYSCFYPSDVLEVYVDMHCQQTRTVFGPWGSIKKIWYPLSDASLVKKSQLTTASLQVTSRWPCWLSRTKAFLFSWNLNPFSCKFLGYKFVLLTPNKAALSRGCKPGIDLFAFPFRTTRCTPEN